MPVLLFIILFSLSAVAAEATSGAFADPDVAENSLSTAAATEMPASSGETGTVVASADTTKSMDSKNDEVSAEGKREPCKNIPLPRQTAYTGKGISIGLGAGIYSPTDECDCLGIWQGQLEYFYTDWISAGIDVRFFGGDLDSDVMVMYQRYRLNMRFHKAWQRLDLFLEPVLAFENISISEFRKQWENRGKPAETQPQNVRGEIPSWVADALEDSLNVNGESAAELDGACERMLSLDGFSVGLGGGVGVNLNRLFGLTGSVLVEYNFSEVVQLSLIPGVAFNLREVWPWAKKNLLSTWIMAEFGTLRYFNKGVKKWSNYGLIGLQLSV